MVELKITMLTEKFKELEDIILLYENYLKPSLYVISIISFFILFFITKYVRKLSDDEKNKLQKNNLYTFIFVFFFWGLTIGTIIFLGEAIIYILNNVNPLILLLLLTIFYLIFYLKYFSKKNIILLTFFFLHNWFLKIKNFSNYIISQFKKK